MKAPTPADREAFKHRHVLPRFRDAFRGLYLAYREEPNLRFHVFAGSCVALGAYAVRVEPWEAAYLGVTVALVLLAEMANTAVERTVDLASGSRRHPLAARAKEVAAGAVLLAAAHSAAAAVVIFVVRHGFLHTVSAVWDMLLLAPWLLAVPVMTGLLALLGGEGPIK